MPCSEHKQGAEKQGIVAFPDGFTTSKESQTLQNNGEACGCVTFESTSVLLAIDPAPSKTLGCHSFPDHQKCPKGISKGYRILAEMPVHGWIWWGCRQTVGLAGSALPAGRHGRSAGPAVPAASPRQAAGVLRGSVRLVNRTASFRTL